MMSHRCIRTVFFLSSLLILLTTPEREPHHQVGKHGAKCSHCIRADQLSPIELLF